MSGYCSDAELGICPGDDEMAEARFNDRADRYERGERAPCRNPECYSGGCPECCDDEESAG